MVERERDRCSLSQNGYTHTHSKRSSDKFLVGCLDFCLTSLSMPFDSS